MSVGLSWSQLACDILDIDFRAASHGKNLKQGNILSAINFLISHSKKVPSAWLLVLQLLVLIALPVLDSSVAGHMVSWVLGTLVLMTVALIIRNSPIFTSVGMVLVVIALSLSAWAFLTDNNALFAIAHIFEAAAYFYAAAGMVMYMFDDEVVTRDELFAVPAVFTLLVWGFAFLYSVCQQWYPNSFTALNNADQARTWLELLFLSFAVFSGVGMSDILPISSPARVLSAIEMFAGVMYLTLVVARLVGFSQATQNRHK
jgi:Ion channel